MNNVKKQTIWSGRSSLSTENDTLSVCASSSFLNQRVAQIITEMQVEMTITNYQFLRQGVSGANFSHGCYFCSELLSSFMALHSQMFQMVNCSNFGGKCLSIIILHGQRIIIPLPGSVFQLSNLDFSNSHENICQLFSFVFTINSRDPVPPKIRTFFI